MRRLKKLLLILISLIIVVIVGAYLFQEKFIFLPSKLDQDYTYNFDQDFEEIFIEAEDGARLNALHFKSEIPKGIVLYFHGNSGDLSRWGKIAAQFVPYNYDVLIMDYRTYGKSTGKLSEETLYADAELFYQKAMELFPEGKIIVYGRSLGTGIASNVASKHNPKSLILETPFYNFEKLIRDKLYNLPVGDYLKYKFPNAQHLTNVKCKITIIHGSDDEVVPYEWGYLLYRTIPESQANLLRLEKGRHNNLAEFEEYQLFIYKELQ